MLIKFKKQFYSQIFIILYSYMKEKEHTFLNVL